MADELGYNHRDYRGTRGAIDDADPSSSETRKGLTRGRTGVSRPASPRRGVRDAGEAHEGEDGEKAYGAPTSPAPVQQGESEKRKVARPDPLKKE